jgi:hypothetical protein
MLVVIALTILLLTLLFIPVTRSLDLVQRANAQVEGQDNIRKAARRITKELGMAMEVYDPRPLTLYGFNNWQFQNKTFLPTAAATPESYVVQGGVLAFRLPKHRYYCTQFDHFVNPTEFNAAFSLDSCPRHPGAPVELRPTMPLEPDDTIVAYFVGLKDPTLVLNGSPLYRNQVYFGSTGNQTLDSKDINTYSLYRVEFDPTDPNFANWNLANGQPNPSFFYDTATASGTGGNGQPFVQNWKNATISVMSGDLSDLVRWLESSTAGAPKAVPHTLFSEGPSAVYEEVAQPNRSVGQFGLFPGQTAPAVIPPIEYNLEYGHWVGQQGDGTVPIAPAALTAPTLNPPQLGPQIRVFDQVGGGLVFDSKDPAAANRKRLLAYDSVTGRVMFGFPRADATNNDPLLREYYEPKIQQNASDFFVDLKNDNAPASLGAALGTYPTTRIVPGSEVVQLQTATGMEQLRRVGWTGLSDSLDRRVAPENMAVNEYSIDYSNDPNDPSRCFITLSDRPEAVATWEAILAGSSGNPPRLLVKYSVQTNLTTDVVRVSYVTKELAAVHLGVVQFTRRNREALPFEVTERVVVRNLKK